MFTMTIKKASSGEKNLSFILNHNVQINITRQETVERSGRLQELKKTSLSAKHFTTKEIHIFNEIIYQGSTVV